MSNLKEIGERLYRCKACGYEAKSAAGLTGHVQLAHGERASGKEELAKIGDEIAKFREEFATNMGQMDNDAVRQLASEFHELNTHLRYLRETRSQEGSAPRAKWEAVPAPIGASAREIAPAMPQPNNTWENIGKIAVGVALMALIASVLRSEE